MKRLLLLLCLLAALTSRADDGMWFLPLMQQQGLDKKLVAAGLQLKPSEVYANGQPSLTDCIGKFGGGCTGEIVSHDGLVFTNHHCGFSYVHDISTEAENLTADGFFARSRSEERQVPGLTFSFIREMRDVTDEVRARAKKEGADVYLMQSEAFLEPLAEEMQQADAEKGVREGQKGLAYSIEPLFNGNRFYLFVEQTFTDVRLVASPPYQVAQFGGNSDNWIWPRQNVDFAVFRIYADADGQPREFCAENVPLHCEQALTLSLQPLKEGDFTMILGFPGSTSRYQPGEEVRLSVEHGYVPFTEIGEPLLRYYESVMDKSATLRLYYEDEYFMIANAVKYYGGCAASSRREGIVGKALARDQKVREYAQKHKKSDCLAALDSLHAFCAAMEGTAAEQTTRSLLLYGLHFRPLAVQVRELAGSCDTTAFEECLQAAEEYVGSTDSDFDRGVLTALLPKALNSLHSDLTRIDLLRTAIGESDAAEWVADAFRRSVLTHPDLLRAAWEAGDSTCLADDPLVLMLRAFNFNSESEAYKMMQDAEEKCTAWDFHYTQTLCDMNKWLTPPDANFTMRLTYGKVCDLMPRDAVHYAARSHATGMLEKISATQSDYFPYESFVKAIQSGAYGDYADADGTLPACFLTDNDITGGNSGSPVLNAHGHLVGLAFDGNIESLSSQYAFHPALQRSINVDIRYVLFTLIQFGGSQYLLDELQIVK